MEKVDNGPGTAIIVNFHRNHPDLNVRADAECTHCAIYLGRGLILDTKFGKAAAVRRLSSEAGRRRIAVLRLDPAHVSDSEVLAFLDIAMQLEGVPYPFWPWQYRSWLSGKFLTNPASLLCSALIEFSLRTAGINLRLNSGHTPVVPPSFLHTSLLSPIRAVWCTPK